MASCWYAAVERTSEAACIDDILAASEDESAISVAESANALLSSTAADTDTAERELAMAADAADTDATTEAALTDIAEA